MTNVNRTETAAEVDAESAPLERRVADLQAKWKAEAKALGILVTAFGPLAKATTYQDLSKLPALLEKTETKVAALAVGDRGKAALDEIRSDLRERRKSMQERLAKDLSAACQAQGLELRVLRREEPVEVRIAPFAVVIDREKGKAELRFARLRLEECAADATAIVETHDRVLAELRRDFEAERFFDACLKAWRAACGAGSAGASERVEILEFLPYLTLQLQSRAFSVEPSESNFRGYSRVRFAYDVQRLRREGGLTRDGWRMNLGVATGTTASKKNRTIFFEDEHGDGEFKLTVFFTRAETRR